MVVHFEFGYCDLLSEACEAAAVGIAVPGDCRSGTTAGEKRTESEKQTGAVNLC